MYHVSIYDFNHFLRHLRDKILKNYKKLAI